MSEAVTPLHSAMSAVGSVSTVSQPASTTHVPAARLAGCDVTASVSPAMLRGCDVGIQVSTDSAKTTLLTTSVSSATMQYATSAAHGKSAHTRNDGYGVFCASRTYAPLQAAARTACRLHVRSILSSFAFLSPDEPRGASSVVTTLLPYRGQRSRAPRGGGSGATPASVHKANPRESMSRAVCVAVALSPTRSHAAEAVTFAAGVHNTNRSSSSSPYVAGEDSAGDALWGSAMATRARWPSPRSLSGAAAAAAADAALYHELDAAGVSTAAGSGRVNTDSAMSMRGAHDVSSFAWGRPPRGATRLCGATTAPSSSPLRCAWRRTSRTAAVDAVHAAAASPATVVERCRALLRDCAGVVMASVVIAVDEADTAASGKSTGVSTAAAAADACVNGSAEYEDDDSGAADEGNNNSSRSNRHTTHEQHQSSSPPMVVVVPLVCDAAVTTLLVHPYAPHTLLAGTREGGVVGWSLCDVAVTTTTATAAATATTTAATAAAAATTADVSASTHPAPTEDSVPLSWWLLSPRRLRQLAWSTTGTATTVLLLPQRPAYASLPMPLLHGGAVLQLTVRGDATSHHLCSLADDGRVCVWQTLSCATPLRVLATRTAYLGTRSLEHRICAAAFVDNVVRHWTTAAAVAQDEMMQQRKQDATMEKQSSNNNTSSSSDGGGGDEDDVDDDESGGGVGRMRVYVCTMAGELLYGHARDAHVMELQRCRGGVVGGYGVDEVLFGAIAAAVATDSSSGGGHNNSSSTNSNRAFASLLSSSSTTPTAAATQSAARTSSASPVWGAITAMAVQPPRQRHPDGGGPRAQNRSRGRDNKDDGDDGDDECAVLLVALDGGVLLWRRQRYAVVRGVDGAAVSVCWSPSRRHIFAVGDAEGVVYVYNMYSSLHVPVASVSLSHATATAAAAACGGGGAAAMAAYANIAMLPSPLRRLHTRASLLSPAVAAGTAAMYATPSPGVYDDDDNGNDGDEAAGAAAASVTAATANMTVPSLLSSTPMPITCLAFSSDGCWLFAGLSDGDVHIVQLSPALCSS